MNGIQLRRKVARLKAAKEKEIERDLARGVCWHVEHMTPGNVRVSNRAAVSNFTGLLSKVMAVVVVVLIATMFFVPRTPV